MGNIKVTEIESIKAGASRKIDIVYPYNGGTNVVGWNDKKAEVIEGNDVVSISDFTITGMKPGVARDRVSVTTILLQVAYDGGYKDKIYSVEFTIRLE